MYTNSPKNELFKLIDILANGINTATTATSTPKMNIIENSSCYKLEVCVPGLTKDDLNLTIDEDDNLIIAMEKNAEELNAEGDRHYLRHDFYINQFKQLFALPDNVQKNKITAKVENGILNVVLPKINPEEVKKTPQIIVVE